jgi:hypothetical protein
MSKVLKEWTENYGKTYGIYVGHMPFIVTSDLDFVNDLCIKQYNNFSAKKVKQWFYKSLALKSIL